MDSKGNHTDRFGQVLTVGTPVRMNHDEPLSGQTGSGVIESIPKEGSDWYGFPAVRFDHDGKVRHVSDTGLVVIDGGPAEPESTDSPEISALFALIESREEEIATSYRLIRALRAQAKQDA